MSRAATKKIVSVAVVAIAATALSFFVGDAEAQRALTPVDGAECLVITGSVPEDALRVLGSRELMRESYGEGDELFVGGTGVAGLTVGQRLQFVRRYGDVRHPDTNEVIAEAIGWLGFAEVMEVGADRAIVHVTKSCREIEVGELLLEPDSLPLAQVDSFPDYVPLRLVTPADADAVIILGELESVVSESGRRRVSAARDAYAQRDLVIIDQGSVDGWSPGDIVDLYRGESVLKAQTTAATYTPTLLAIGLVVAVGDQAATVLIVEGDLPVEIGDRVRRSTSSGG
ncbi:MAG: hypothetical protein IH849_07985 [Acidobacteria bacterium]|nr:hypothetical protein [Acidobacteriota bacterium]